MRTVEGQEWRPRRSRANRAALFDIRLAAHDRGCEIGDMRRQELPVGIHADVMPLFAARPA